MKHFILRSVATLTLGALFAASALAQSPAGNAKPRFIPVTHAVEAVAGAVVLPSGPGGSLVMSTCHECAPRTFGVNAATEYFIGEQPVTLAQLRAAVAEAPSNILTVSYDIETGVVSQVSAVR